MKENSLSENILSVLTAYQSSYKAARRRALGLRFKELKDEFHESFSDATFRSTLSRLKKNGLIEHSGERWSITTLGAVWIAKYPWRTNVPRSKRTMIVSFDIPEVRRRDRDWLRTELKFMHFSILQHSVWFGPAPLPAEFVAEIKNKKLAAYLKFFEVKEKEIA